MSLILSLGTNIGNKNQNLLDAINGLGEFLKLEAQSRVYTSPAVDYIDQPDFYNQVLQFQIPDLRPQELMQKILLLEKQMGRERKIDKGPRIIDIDVLFWNTEKIEDISITVPHPRLFDRSFICLPLQELPYYEFLKNHFHFSNIFDNKAYPL